LSAKTKHGETWGRLENISKAKAVWMETVGESKGPYYIAGYQILAFIATAVLNYTED